MGARGPSINKMGALTYIDDCCTSILDRNMIYILHCEEEINCKFQVNL